MTLILPVQAASRLCSRKQNSLKTHRHPDGDTGSGREGGKGRPTPPPEREPEVTSRSRGLSRSGCVCGGVTSGCFPLFFSTWCGTDLVLGGRRESPGLFSEPPERTAWRTPWFPQTEARPPGCRGAWGGGQSATAGSPPKWRKPQMHGESSRFSSVPKANGHLYFCSSGPDAQETRRNGDAPALPRWQRREAFSPSYLPCAFTHVLSSQGGAGGLGVNRDLFWFPDGLCV